MQQRMDAVGNSFGGRVLKQPREEDEEAR